MGPCRMVSPILEELADENLGKVKICKLNVDENMEVAGKFGITAIPSVFLFKDGEELTDKLSELAPKLREALELIGSSPATLGLNAESKIVTYRSDSYGAPLIATSANLSGEPVLTNEKDVETRLGINWKALYSCRRYRKGRSLQPPSFHLRYQLSYYPMARL